MKKITSRMLTRFLIILFLGVSVVGCKKGDDGTPGIDGDNGQDGSDGSDGNANVRVDTFLLRNSDWTFGFFYLGGGGGGIIYGSKIYDRNFSAINDDVLRKGAVLVFFNTNIAQNGPDEWTPLNFTLPIQGYSHNYVFQQFPGKIRLVFFFGETSTSALPNVNTYTLPDHKFKIVAIGGSTTGNSVVRKNGISYTKSDLQAMSYEQVCELMNIKKM